MGRKPARCVCSVSDVLLRVGKQWGFRGLVKFVDTTQRVVRLAPELDPLVAYVHSRFGGADLQFIDVVFVQEAILSGRTTCAKVQAAMEKVLSRAGVCDDYHWER